MRIAFAEDDKQLRTTVSRGLREAGYAVDQAASGPQVLALLAEHQYDAIILDVMIPAPDGIAVCRTLRAAGNRTPILMLTALDAVDKRITGLDAGADDYVTKPFDFGELLARLRAVVRRNVDSVAPLLTVGDLVIDTRRHRVSRGSRQITLTAKEYAFVLYLATNAGRVVGRGELLTHVWSDARNTYSNIIDVYASRVRRKIDDGEAVPLLSTVRGAGFVLSPPDGDARTESPAGAASGED
ncbi:MAG: response regulator transcription factor [Gemmatimonadaceae bacterium]|nr:response regulator transcription factor [Gemmatimonadaceae bacterium]